MEPTPRLLWVLPMLAALLAPADGRQVSVSGVRFFRNTNVVCLELSLSHGSGIETRLVSQNLVLAYEEVNDCRRAISSNHIPMNKHSCEASERIICSQRSRAFTGNKINLLGIRGNVTVELPWRTNKTHIQPSQETWEVDTSLKHLESVHPEYSRWPVADLCSLYRTNCENCTLSCSNVFNDKGVTCGITQTPPRGGSSWLPYKDASSSPLRVNITGVHVDGVEVCVSFRIQNSGGIPGDWQDVWQTASVHRPEKVYIRMKNSDWMGHPVNSSDECHVLSKMTFTAEDPAREGGFCLKQTQGAETYDLSEIVAIRAKWFVRARSVGKQTKFSFLFPQSHEEVPLRHPPHRPAEGFEETPQKCAGRTAAECRYSFFSAVEGSVCETPARASEESGPEMHSKKEETCEEALVQLKRISLPEMHSKKEETCEEALVQLKRISLHPDADLVCMQLLFDDTKWEIVGHNLTLSLRIGLQRRLVSERFDRLACTTDQGYLCAETATPVVESWVVAGISGNVEIRCGSLGETTSVHGRHIIPTDDYRTSTIRGTGSSPRYPRPPPQDDRSSSSVKCSEMIDFGRRAASQGAQIGRGQRERGNATPLTTWTPPGRTTAEAQGDIVTWAMSEGGGSGESFDGTFWDAVSDWERELSRLPRNFPRQDSGVKQFSMGQGVHLLNPWRTGESGGSGANLDRRYGQPKGFSCNDCSGSEALLPPPLFSLALLSAGAHMVARSQK